MLDLDRFKPINDTFGHAAGSTAIVAISRILRETFRESDIIARLSGDEFAVLAPGVAREDVKSVLGRLEEALDSYNHKSRAYCLSLSVGTHFVPFDNTAPLDELVARADAAMYEQKRSRHDIVSAPTNGSVLPAAALV